MPPTPPSVSEAESPRERLLGRLAVLVAALLFSTGGAAIKAIELSAWQVASLRSGIAAVAIALFMPRALRRLSWRSAAVGVAYAATMILFVVANKLTTAAHTIFLQSTAPLYVLALGPRLLGERGRRSDLAWMALLALGLAAFFAGREAPQTTAPDPLAGNLLAAAAGATWGATILGLRWLGRQGGAAGGTGGVGGRGAGGGANTAAAAVLAGNAIACLAALPAALPIPAATAGDWAILGYLGVFQVALAYVFLTGGLARVPALEVSLLLLVEPLFSPLWAWLLHGERPGAAAWVGATLVLAATIGKSVAAERRRRRAAATPG